MPREKELYRDTLERIRQRADELYPEKQICSVVGGDPQWLRYTAREAPQELGFPVTVIRSRVKIPRIPFCRFMGWI